MDTSETDVLVIGGGIHGCGVAQAAAARGLRVLLVEQDEIASGTSSRSSKLVHGGLRYLETAQFSLVREALHERETLLRIAPEIVHKERFYIPIYEYSSRPAWKIAAGLMLYRFIAGSGNDFHYIPRHQWNDVLPGLSRDGLQTVFQYWDAATDDAALTQAVMNSAVQMGAEILTQCSTRTIKQTQNGLEVHLSNGDVVQTSALVNAAGPWVNQILQSISPSTKTLAISLVKGSHIILPQEQETFVYSEAADGRAVFIMPWKGQTMVGTTEVNTTDFKHPVPNTDEISYLLNTYHRHYPSRAFSKKDVVDCFAGVRVLPGGSGSFTGRAREVRILCDDFEHARLLTIYGGKLTTYRHTAERVMQLLLPVLPVSTVNLDTADINLG